MNLFMASEPACSARNEMDLMVDNKLGLGSGFRSLGFRSSSTVHTHTHMWARGRKTGEPQLGAIGQCVGLISKCGRLTMLDFSHYIYIVLTCTHV